jgi:hypothetical protein
VLLVAAGIEVVKRLAKAVEETRGASPGLADTAQPRYQISRLRQHHRLSALGPSDHPRFITVAA